jgi:hypothetical protein
MTDRVHASLDGELPRDELTPAELAHLETLESVIDAAGHALRTAPAPDLTAAVMRSLPPLPAPPPSLLARLHAWFWEPRVLTVRYRPVLALAGLAAAALAGVVVAPRIGSTTPDAVPAVASEGSSRLYVQFRLEAPGAEHVQLAGSFTGWRADYELSEVAPGVWTVLVPLQPGVYDYTFVVDGERWVADPYAPQVDDSFGGTNSRLFLPSPADTA